MNLLSSNTVAPLGLSIAVIGSAAFWLSNVSAKVEAHERIIVETKVKQERTADDLGQIRIDIGVIKQVLLSNQRR